MFFCLFDISVLKQISHLCLFDPEVMTIVSYFSSCICFMLQENQDMLIKCVSQDLGFSSGRPIAACLIYRCLLHWRSFEVERTGVFDRIIQTIGTAIEVINNILLVHSALPPFSWKLESCI